MTRTLHLLLAATAAAALGLWAWHHPFGPLAPSLAAAVLALAFALRPGLWLVLLPALWPVIDLAPWTGWIHFTESDALALAVISGVGLREALAPPVAAGEGAAFRTSPAALGLFALLALSYGISAWRVPFPLPPYDAALFSGYKTPLNALRLLKGFVLALALLPALHAAGRALGERAPRALGTGLVAGLLAASAAAAWERYHFPGLTNFSADYRTTGLFWDMHVGGAALDAWLALGFPFALAAFLRVRTAVWRVALLAALALAAYALLTTFSRGLYAAVALSLPVLLLAMRRPPGAPDGPRTVRFGGWLAAAAVFAVAPASFAGGGYRGLAALLGFALLVYLAGGAPASLPAGRKLAALLGGLALGALAAAAAWLPKGPYLAFGALWLAGAAAGAALLSDPKRTGMAAVALTLAAAAGVAAAIVGIHWGEGEGVAGIVGAVLTGYALLAWQLTARPLWRTHVDGTLNAVLVLGAAAAVAAGLGSYYVGERFSTTAEDLAGRMAHWREGAHLVDSTAGAWLGIGLGRYPEAYFWLGPLAANAGSWQLAEEDGNRFARLGPARHVLGFGELFRVSQRVAGDAAGPFLYRLRLRAPAASALHLEVCRKHLLYTQQCAAKEVRIDEAQWVELSGSIEAGSLGPDVVAGARVFSMAVSSRAPVDVDALEIVDAAGRSLIANGDFQRGVDRWFFSSDRHHLPWHAKSMPLHVWVEQGWLGLAAVGLTLLAATGRLAFGRAHSSPLAAPLLAGLCGFVVVGLFDSLLDMPRLTLMLFLLCWVALSLRPPLSAPPTR